VVDAGRGRGDASLVHPAPVPNLYPPMASAPTAPRRIAPYDKDAKMLPQITVAVEHYNRIVRMIQAGEKVRMEANIAVEYQDADLNGYNTVAEIPGTDPQLKDEIVMLGGPMDSCHSGPLAPDH